MSLLSSIKYKSVGELVTSVNRLCEVRISADEVFNDPSILLACSSFDGRLSDADRGIAHRESNVFFTTGGFVYHGTRSVMFAPSSELEWHLILKFLELLGTDVYVRVQKGEPLDASVFYKGNRFTPRYGNLDHLVDLCLSAFVGHGYVVRWDGLWSGVSERVLSMVREMTPDAVQSVDNVSEQALPNLDPTKFVIGGVAIGFSTLVFLGFATGVIQKWIRSLLQQDNVAVNVARPLLITLANIPVLFDSGLLVHKSDGGYVDLEAVQERVKLLIGVPLIARAIRGKTRLGTFTIINFDVKNGGLWIKLQNNEERCVVEVSDDGFLIADLMDPFILGGNLAIGY